MIKYIICFLDIPAVAKELCYIEIQIIFNWEILKLKRKIYWQIQNFERHDIFQIFVYKERCVIIPVNSFVVMIY